MSIEPNSVRLQRLTKTMELTSPRSTSVMENHSELVKLPALRAINKGIKYNDLSFTTSRDLNKLKKEPEQIDNIEEVSAHHSLVVIRKRYDNMSKDRQATQKRVEMLQSEHDKLNSDKNNFESAKNGGKGKVSDLGSSLKAMKLQLQEAEIERKIMNNMILRIKSDKVVYDLRKYNMEKQLEKTKKFRRLIEEQNKKGSESDDKTEKMKAKLLRHIANEKQERDMHLSSVQGILNEKEDMVINEGVRGEEMKQIALITLQDKDIKQKNWYKCYLCTRLVEKLLRDKMHREMMKFNTVEVAFKNIKTATGVNNGDTLIQKFLNKEDTYGDLLGKIAENEKMIASVKLEAEELRKEERLLEIQQEQLNQTRKESKDLSHEEKELNRMSSKSLSCQTYEQKTTAWLRRTFKKLDLERGTENEEEETEDSKVAIVADFKAYLVSISKTIEQLDSVDVDDENETEVSLNSKNCRIVVGYDERVEFDRIDDRKYYEQDDHIDGERTGVIRNNDKFMKDLKRKYEQIKREQIEAMPKKREAPVEKPKQAPAPVEA